MNGINQENSSFTPPSRILVIDNNSPTRQDMVRMLQIAGYETSDADCAPGVLTIMQHTRFDMLVLDMCSPGNMGLGLLQQATLQDPGMAIVVLTDYSMLETAIAAIRGKVIVVDYLLKPITNDAFLRTVNQGLQQREKRLTQSRRANFGSFFPALEPINRTIQPKPA